MRISVNKLGEFLVTSSPTRRRSIIRDQKTPPDVVVPRYRKAMDPIAAYLNSGGVDVAPVIQAIETLRNDHGKTDWAKSDNANTAAALEAFLDIADSLPMDGVTYVPGDPSPPRLTVAGVEISVRPDFLLYVDRKGKKFAGMLKLHFIKDENRALRQTGQEYVASLLHKWLQDYPPVADAPPLHTHCLSVDLFRTSVVKAPASFTRRMNDIEAACAEIALLWPTL